MTRRLIALLAGPLLFFLIALLPAPAGMTDAAKLTAAVTAWVAVWWITEPVHIAVASLLPLVLFPLCGVMPLKSTSAEFGNEIIFLFMGGFLFGKTIERWHLHNRIALNMVLWLGSNPGRMVLGFMLATGFISMWISNTATAVMMTPVAIAVGARHKAGTEGESGANFGKVLLLGVGYACSIGGLATIVGTPTNAIFIGFAEQKLGESVSFARWLAVGFPFALLLLLICWWMLLRLFPIGKSGHEKADTDLIRSELAALGTISTAEKRLLWVFGLVILGWTSGSLLWYKWFPNCNDTVVVLTGAIALFLVPAGAGWVRPATQAEGNWVEQDIPAYKALLDWETAVKIPWDIMLLFGGGLALAKGFDASGLAAWLGKQMEGLGTLPHVLILLVVLSVVVLLSEIASNIATASMMMPVLATLATTIGSHPTALLMSATLAASFGFGLPIATAPNSIVFSSGYIRTRDMARAGFLLDAVAILLLLLFVYTLLPFVWGVKV